MAPKKSFRITTLWVWPRRHWSARCDIWRRIWAEGRFASMRYPPGRSKRWPRADSLRPADPLHCDVPALRDAEIAAVYYDHRMAGDFYEFLRVGRSRML